MISQTFFLRAEKKVSKMFYQVDCNDENREWKKHQKFDQTVQLQRGEKLAGRIEPRTIDLSEDLNWNHFKIKSFKWRRKEGLFDDMLNETKQKLRKGNWKCSTNALRIRSTSI
jgi:hypothetical protein